MPPASYCFDISFAHSEGLGRFFRLTSVRLLGAWSAVCVAQSIKGNMAALAGAIDISQAFKRDLQENPELWSYYHRRLFALLTENSCPAVLRLGFSVDMAMFYFNVRPEWTQCVSTKSIRLHMSR